MDISIETLEARPVLGIRERVNMAEIGDTVTRLMPELMAVAGPHAAGPVLTRWHDWEGDRGEMELAVPVGGEVAGSGRVAAAELPACRAAVVWHVGPYDNLKDTWGGLSAWVAAEGHESGGAPWEEYVSDCEVTPPEELRTRIVWPIS